MRVFKIITGLIIPGIVLALTVTETPVAHFEKFDCHALSFRTTPDLMHFSCLSGDQKILVYDGKIIKGEGMYYDKSERKGIRSISDGRQA